MFVRTCTVLATNVIAVLILDSTEPYLARMTYAALSLHCCSLVVYWTENKQSRPASHFCMSLVTVDQMLELISAFEPT